MAESKKDTLEALFNNMVERSSNDIREQYYSFDGMLSYDIPDTPHAGQMVDLVTAVKEYYSIKNGDRVKNTSAIA